MKHQFPGTFIVIEGIDGAGKTTQADLLAEFFAVANEPFVRSKEPTDGPWGQKIRQSAANGRMSLADELTAFVEDRKEHLRDKIIPTLAAGKTVILDRYFYSTIAYQGSRGGDMDAIAAQMLAIAPEPDITILLDVPVRVGLWRIADSRGEEPNAFEDVANLTAVRMAFKCIAEKLPNITSVDGEPSRALVRRAILKVLIDGVLKARHCEKPWGCDGLMCGHRIMGECRWYEMARVAAQLPG